MNASEELRNRDAFGSEEFYGDFVYTSGNIRDSVNSIKRGILLRQDSYLCSDSALWACETILNMLMIIEDISSNGKTEEIKGAEMTC